MKAYPPPITCHKCRDLYQHHMPLAQREYESVDVNIAEYYLQNGFIKLIFIVMLIHYFCCQLFYNVDTFIDRKMVNFVNFAKQFMNIIFIATCIIILYSVVTDNTTLS